MRGGCGPTLSVEAFLDLEGMLEVLGSGTEAAMIDGPRLPGDLPAGKNVERMIRVDHASEYGGAHLCRPACRARPRREGRCAALHAGAGAAQPGGAA